MRTCGNCANCRHEQSNTNYQDELLYCKKHKQYTGNSEFIANLCHYFKENKK